MEVVLAKALFPLLMLLPWRRAARLVGLRVHVWKYRNPACRTCKHCNLCQMEIAMCTVSENPLDRRNPSWWEDQYKAPERPIRCWF